MSLLGRLEDLSLTDIIQIVFLSRRTGVLEVLDDRGRHAVFFRNGLVVNAASPEARDLITWFENVGVASPPLAARLRQMAAEGTPPGDAVLESAALSIDQLQRAIRDRVIDVIAPLVQSRAGSFNFLVSDSLRPADIEFDPELLFHKSGGFTPQEILAIEGDKLQPLRALQEEMRAGLALLRREPPSGKKSGAQFRVAGGLIEVESPEASYRNVVVFERDPMIRVAEKRAFKSCGARVAQFGSIDGARDAVSEYLRSTAFFVTFLEITAESIALMQSIKRKNPRLPVMMLDSELDLSRRQEVLDHGADLYVTKPRREQLLPARAEEELRLFADELVVFAESAFDRFSQLHGPDAARRFYDEGQREHLDRSFSLLEQLINELSNRRDIREVASTILRLASQYLDRGVLFVVSEDGFAGLGGFGSAGDGEALDARARALRLERSEPSILRDVVESGTAHRGKMKRTAANSALIEQLGGATPTEVVALPIMHNGRTLGILYGDNAEHRAPIDSMNGLEIFLAQAGYAFGNAISSERA